MAMAVENLIYEALEQNILSGVSYAENNRIRSSHVIDQKVNQTISEVLEWVNCTVAPESQAVHFPGAEFFLNGL